jgi:hypothetical protein
MNRPRTFCWVSRNGVPFPQILFEPRVGCQDLPIVASTERKLQPAEYALTLTQLVERYPAPEMV